MRYAMIIMLVLLCLVMTIGHAQQLFVGNVHPLSWNPRTAPAFATQMYEVGVKDETDPDNVYYILGETTEPEFDADISEFDFEVTFAVRTVWNITQDNVIINSVTYNTGDRVESDWNDSIRNGVWTPNPFVGLRGVLAPDGLKHGSQ